MNLYQQVIYKSRYARWNDDLKRRENWDETVDRYINFIDKQSKKFGYTLLDEEINSLRNSILNLEVMPSMRLMMTAGEAAELHAVAAYNCSYVTIDNPRSFDELMYILMNGTGVGFSVEEKYVKQLPPVAEEMFDTDTTIKVGDSKVGWSSAFRELISLLYAGKVPQWDMSKVRPKGSRLKTFGGRASGPQPLIDLFEFTVNLFKNAAGRRLSTLEAHDLVCKIADIVVVGGVRRSALISLSDLGDNKLRTAKSGKWWEGNVQRALANNSAVYEEKPDLGTFMEEWLSLYQSKSGERGIFNRQAAINAAKATGRRDYETTIYGINPCAEILLRPQGFCNLTEVIIRQDDTKNTLKNKIKIATILGTIQSSLTDFKYLRAIWRKNAEEERLLGVSLTGIVDNLLTSNPDPAFLQELKQVAIDTNKEWAEKLRINQSAAITTVKPSGCRPWNALTTTDRGILTLEEIFDISGHSELEVWKHLDTELNAPQKESKAKITKTFNNGYAQVKKIKLTYGLTLESTANHQWFVSKRRINNKFIEVNDFVRSDELKSGDVIEVIKDSYRNTIPAKLKSLSKLSLSMRQDCADIYQPEYMSEDLAWLLGYLWGDGAMSPSKYRIRWVDGYTPNLLKAQRIIKDVFNIDAEIRPASQGRKAEVLEVASKILWHWLILNDVWKYSSDKLDLIPLVVRKSDYSHVISFISGMLDADGWKGLSPTGFGKVTFTTADENFANHFQHVAWAVGLGFGLSKNTGGKNHQKQKNMFLMALGGFSSEEAVKILALNSNKLTELSSNSEFKGWQCLNLHHNQLVAGEVFDVEDGDIKPTYDIETENHWFYAGAFKSHNTVSQLVGCSSGIHPSFSPYYIRTIRADQKDPLAQFLRMKGVPCEVDVTKPNDIYVFSFPVKSAENSVTADKVDAISQLEMYKVYKENWTEHNVSITVYVKEHEWVKVGAWVYENFDIIGGVSFLPYAEHTYKQAPYQKISEEQYNELLSQMPTDFDWNELSLFEVEDATNGTKELACSAGSCEISNI